MLVDIFGSGRQLAQTCESGFLSPVIRVCMVLPWRNPDIRVTPGGTQGWGVDAASLSREIAALGPESGLRDGCVCSRQLLSASLCVYPPFVPNL